MGLLGSRFCQVDKEAGIWIKMITVPAFSLHTASHQAPNDELNPSPIDGSGGR